MLKRTDYLTKRYGLEESWKLSHYLHDGGYKQARRAMRMKREEIVEEAKAANLRGRGGAGFPMGVKWGFMPVDDGKPHYLVVNADEGEPGTFKDRTLMEKDPHAIIEGCIIGCRGIGANAAYIYVRDELHLAKERLWDAIAEAKAKGYLGDRPFSVSYPVEVYVHSGAGAYICGEESALLNSLEGRRGEPRLRPPFPAQAGAFGMPTTVNNLESIATVPTILSLGGANFSKLSDLHDLRDGGCRLFGVSGHVNTPGIFECAVGLTLRELIYDRLRPEWFEWLRGPDAPDTYVVYTNFRTGSKHTASPRDEGMSRERFLDAVLASASVPGLMTATVVDGEPCYDGCLRDLVPVDRAIELGATTLLPVMLDPETIRDHEPRFDRLDRIMVRAFSILVDEVGWSDLEIARDRVRGVLIRNELLRIDDELAAARQSGAIRRARRAIQDLVSRRELEPLLGGRARLRRIIEGVRPDYELSSTPLDFHPAQMRSWMDHGRDVARRVIATTPFA